MKKEKIFLCIDAGTTRFKAAVINSSGRIIKKADYYYNPLHMRSFKYHTYKPDSFYNALFSTLKKMEISKFEISGIGITGHGQTFVPVNASSAIPHTEIVGYMDERLIKYFNMVKEVKGQNPVSLMYIPLALFYKYEYPEAYSDIDFFLTPADYIIYLLTGSIQTSVSTPSINPWDIEDLYTFDLNVKKFPGFRYMGHPAGKTTYEAEKIFGIMRGIPVFTMGGDFAMGTVGTGTVEKGKSYERFGTSAGINLCWNRGIHDRRILSYRHIVRGFWNVSGIINSAGIAIDWIRRIVGVKEIPEIPINRLGEIPLFLPYLMGEKTPFWSQDVKASIYGIHSKTTAREIIASIILGILLSIRSSIDIIESGGGRFEKPIVISGWWAKQDWFTQLHADTIGRNFAVLDAKDAELIGIAAVLSTITGIYKNLRDAVHSMVHIQKVYRPDKKRYSSLNAIYSKFLTLRKYLYSI